MPAIGFQFNLLQGLSDFWQRFFADADQLEALYKGSAMLIGQAYLDLMSATLGVSLKDAVVFDKEAYHLITIREDEVSFVEGALPANNRWAFTLPDPVVSFASLDNRVVEPTASLEPQLDYELIKRVVQFHADPTDPTGTGIPLNGYARRSLDVEVGGRFNDPLVTSWLTAGVKKGDTLRILDVGQAPDFWQRRREDHSIVIVRTNALYVSDVSALTAPTSGVTYVVLRVPVNAVVQSESFTIALGMATLAHKRIDHGSARVFAKNPAGADVVEGIDYTINYEHGIIYQLTAWQNLPGPYGIDYTWREEVFPTAGIPPNKSITGVIVASTSTTRVLQIAIWAPDTLVDRRTLANNFGALIGRQRDSSETYRTFLEGIFQLYILGPVLERIESALNVVMGLPVVHDDGEIYQSTNLTDPVVDRIFTKSPITGQPVTYEFPKGAPLRTDLVAGQELLSFEVLTTAVAVTDYVQTPSWWYSEAIPEALFSPVNGAVPPIFRRIASSRYVLNVINAEDGPQIGDPGLIIGADEDGFVPPPGQPVFRHRMAFVLMDRYLKYHTFSVKFDAVALSSLLGADFVTGLRDLNELILTSKPSHTYALAAPFTFFRDEIMVTDRPISFNRRLGSRVFGPDKVIFTDGSPVIGAGIWLVGDYFKYEFFTVATAFPAPGVPVVLANAPIVPRRGRLVRTEVQGTIGGLALIENVDYSVDYTNRTVTRLTAWAVTTVNVVYRQLNIGNIVDAPIGAGDMPLLINGVDPALITAAFSPTAAGWDGVITPPSSPQDIGMVERALIVYAHP